LEDAISIAKANPMFEDAEGWAEAKSVKTMEAF
jgi:hypothetical protein